MTEELNLALVGVLDSISNFIDVLSYGVGALIFLAFLILFFSN